ACNVTSGGNVEGALCNPGDRICGPEPRRAPDNKICFSGVGNYALTNGKRAKRVVVFRVDINDRSEPGGTNGPPPPDRYRFRLWLVDATGGPGGLGNPDKGGPGGHKPPPAGGGGLTRGWTDGAPAGGANLPGSGEGGELVPA